MKVETLQKRNKSRAANIKKPDLYFTFHKSVKTDVRVYFGINESQNIVKFLDILNPDKVFIVCDNNIAKIYADSIKKAVAKKYPVAIIVHKSDEANKNLFAVAKMSDDFFMAGGTQNSLIIALGGGLTGNMAGVLASIIFRGIKLVHIPTTLLAQLDSAADVKQSVNSAAVKNSIGSYKAPDAVIIDPLFLKSLDGRKIRAGLGEAVKHGIAQDMNFVEYIVSSDKRDIHVLQKITKKTIQLKIKHWENSPEVWNDVNKVERLTHLGHTIGKILEMIDVDYLTHGEAIAHGMVIEAYMSYLLGYLDLKSVEKIYNIFSGLKLLYPLSNIYTPDKITAKLYATTNQPIFALLKDIGNSDVISTTVQRGTSENALNWYFITKHPY
jgi:3-dehydroquinate synthetase